MVARYGCIEAGGTKVLVAVAEPDGGIGEIVRITTADPRSTLDAVRAHLRSNAGDAGFQAIRLASFGPLSLDPDRADWGHLLSTPKPGWTGTDLAGPLRADFGCPIGIDTDVNAAALAEARWGAASGTNISVYVTVGTGIGGGVVIEGRTLRGNPHPEMGHFRPARHPLDQSFADICPFHGDCLEGLASGPAIAARWGASLSELPAHHEAHAIVAHYLAQLVVAQRAMLSPARIAFGGGA